MFHISDCKIGLNPLTLVTPVLNKSVMSVSLGGWVDSILEEAKSWLAILVLDRQRLTKACQGGLLTWVSWYLRLSPPCGISYNWITMLLHFLDICSCTMITHTTLTVLMSEDFFCCTSTVASLLILMLSAWNHSHRSYPSTDVSSPKNQRNTKLCSMTTSTAIMSWLASWHVAHSTLSSNMSSRCYPDMLAMLSQTTGTWIF